MHSGQGQAVPRQVQYRTHCEAAAMALPDYGHIGLGEALRALGLRACWGQVREVSPEAWPRRHLRLQTLRS